MSMRSHCFEAMMVHGPLVHLLLRHGYFVCWAVSIDVSALLGESCDTICNISQDFIACPPRHVYLLWLNDALTKSTDFQKTFNDVLCGPRGGKTFNFSANILLSPDLSQDDSVATVHMKNKVGCLVSTINHVIILLEDRLLRKLPNGISHVKGW